MKKKCKKCKYWKNEQAELDYNTFKGICLSPQLIFTSAKGRSVELLDREKDSGKFNGTFQFESARVKIPIGEVIKSNYCLITDEHFYCRDFKSKKDKMPNDYVCFECGTPFKPTSPNSQSTYSTGKCCICGDVKGVTHKRNFNNLKKPKDEKNAESSST